MMACLVLDQDKLLHGIHNVQKIVDVESWRALKYIENEHIALDPYADETTVETGLLIINRSLYEYFVPDMTVDDFLTIVDQKIECVCKFTFRRAVILCSHCAGIGKSDWINIATGNPVKYTGGAMYEKFKADPKTPLRKTNHYIINQTALGEHEILCPKCGGTGLHFINPSNIGEIK